MKRLTKGVAAGALMSKTMTVLVAVLVAMLAAGVTGVASYATGQGSRMSDEQVRVKVQVAVDRAERQAELHTARMLDHQAIAHAKGLKRARKVARDRGHRIGKSRGYRIGKNEAERRARRIFCVHRELAGLHRPERPRRRRHRPPRREPSEPSGGGLSALLRPEQRRRDRLRERHLGERLHSGWGVTVHGLAREVAACRPPFSSRFAGGRDSGATHPARSPARQGEAAT